LSQFWRSVVKRGTWYEWVCLSVCLSYQPLR